MRILFPTIRLNKLYQCHFGEYYKSEFNLSTYLRLTNGENWFKIEVRLLGFGVEYYWNEKKNRYNNS